MAVKTENTHLVSLEIVNEQHCTLTVAKSGVDGNCVVVVHLLFIGNSIGGETVKIHTKCFASIFSIQIENVATLVSLESHIGGIRFTSKGHRSATNGLQMYDIKNECLQQ